MGDQKTLAENEGAPRVRVTTAPDHTPLDPVDVRRLVRRIDKLERKVRVLERDATARRLKREFEAKPGDV